MVLAEITLALVMAVIIVAIVFFLIKNKGPWGSFWLFFVVEFFAIWAGSVWIDDIDTTHVYWKPMLFTGVLVAMIIMSLTPLFKVLPPDMPEGIDFLEQQHLARTYEQELRKKRKTAFVLLFILMTVFSIDIIVGYL